MNFNIFCLYFYMTNAKIEHNYNNEVSNGVFHLNILFPNIKSFYCQNNKAYAAKAMLMFKFINY